MKSKNEKRRENVNRTRMRLPESVGLSLRPGICCDVLSCKTRHLPHSTSDCFSRVDSCVQVMRWIFCTTLGVQTDCSSLILCLVSSVFALFLHHTASKIRSQLNNPRKRLTKRQAWHADCHYNSPVRRHATKPIVSRVIQPHTQPPTWFQSNDL